MPIAPESWSLAGNLVSAQFSAAWKSFPLPGPVPMAILRKPADQSMLVLQGTEAEQLERLNAELATFEPTLWVVAQVDPPSTGADDEVRALIVRLHEGDDVAELRLDFKPELILVGQEGMPDGEALVAFRKGFEDGYGHELRATAAGPLFDDDWAAGRAMVQRALGDNIRLAGTTLFVVDGQKAATIDLGDPATGVTVTVGSRRLVAVAVIGTVLSGMVAGAGWVCGGQLGLVIAAFPAMFMFLVAVMALREHPVLLLTKGDGTTRIDVRNATMEETHAFVAELPRPKEG